MSGRRRRGRAKLSAVDRNDLAMIPKTGRIVWHDLFTSDRRRAMSLYQHVAGWAYKSEHATDFAWGGGEKDFVLALLGSEAGAGFAETPPALTNGWVAYVEVLDVDAAAALAEKLGGAIVRHPFDVPGVGRNALLRDPLGALFGISLSKHSFPAPRRQFGVEIYLSNAPTVPSEFYSRLFDWEFSSSPSGRRGGYVITGPSGEAVAIHLPGKPPTEAPAVWIPSIKVAHPAASLREAEERGAVPFSQMLAETVEPHAAFLVDPDGALLCLVDDKGEAALDEHDQDD